VSGLSSGGERRAARGKGRGCVAGGEGRRLEGRRLEQCNSSEAKRGVSDGCSDAEPPYRKRRRFGYAALKAAAARRTQADRP
jgi:hypothetical protein